MDVEKAIAEVEAFRSALHHYDQLSASYNPFDMTGTVDHGQR